MPATRQGLRTSRRPPRAAIGLLALLFALPAAAAPPPVDPPALADGLRAFTYARARVEAALEDQPDLPPPDFACGGACITVRLDGQILARGQQTGGANPLADAAELAVLRLRENLPNCADPLAAPAVREQLSRVLISLELAGAAVPIEAATFAEIDTVLAPGLDGVLASIAGNQDAAFPSAMLIANDTPAAAAVSLIAQLSGDPTLPMPGVPGHDVADLRTQRRAAFHRFRVLHLAQISPGGQPITLCRGLSLTPASTIDTPALRSLAQRLTAHTLARRTTVAGRPELWNVYFPWQDRYGEVASPLEKSIAAMALCRAAGLQRRLGDAGPMPPAVECAQDLLVDMLGAQNLAAAESTDCATAAGLWLALDELAPWLRSRQAWFDASRSALIARVREAIDASGAWTDRSPPPTRGLIALALATSADTQAHRAAANAAIAALFRDTPPGQWATHMPFLPWAAARLADHEADRALSTTPLLREARASLWQRQLSAEHLGSLPASTNPGLDLAGGLDLDARSAMSATWQTARPLSFCAWALRDSRLTDPSERLPELSRVLRAARFLRQLTLDESAGAMAPDPRAAAWGVRIAPWDQRQTLDAQSLTLLAIIEAVTSAEWLSRELAKDAPAPPP